MELVPEEACRHDPRREEREGDAAERELIRVALAETSTLGDGLRRVIQRSGGFEANVMGLTRDEADLACRRLQASGTTCFMVGTEE